MNFGKKELLELLKLPFGEFQAGPMAQAKGLWHEQGDRLTAVAMLGYDNVCKNQCLYCGMRASNTGVKRYRMTVDEVLGLAEHAAGEGFRRIFLISGEDPKYGFENLVEMVHRAKGLGLQVSLACGELSRGEYVQLAEAGCGEYALKFEMSHAETFDRLNPSTSFKKRMQAICDIRESGMKLASGNIIDYPGHTLEELADDILLCRELEISWAPVIPYLPAAGTPLAAEGGRGSLELLWREIALLRLMMPQVNITAQQPGSDLREGLAGSEGNLAALGAGANLLFADLLPPGKLENFSVIDNRVTLGLNHIREMAERAGMQFVF